MEKRDTNVYATLQAAVSQQVAAPNKKQALELADFRMNRNNVQLQQVLLQNEIGGKKVFTIEGVEEIRWFDVQLGDYSGRYEVYGHVRVSIRLPVGPEHLIREIQQTCFYLPRSLVTDKTVWVVPTFSKPVFVRVVHQAMEWKKTPALDPASLFRVG
ncbi:hypothetical protein MJA45_25095 [Paenibacillus aurantius]|uniref:Uncharacterized protein n=1 Tax=Paenibacillus aurantius TaxID=2918900 RepID=A0AA96RH89_9BACL|nr:hypothetical protein [Paenibacillus aurantius]WJH35596.1 hypothetical protein N6H14_06225 [Paenibacillus sp. CC-CFT747]WNQ10859.1 hypothetical protein MJA45_25095 [Paenibacillus aurantius]